MKTVLIFFILACCSPLSAFSQKVKLDILYLNTDSVLVGNIVNTVPGVNLTFKTLDQEFLYIQLGEIEQIKHENYEWSNGQLVPTLPDALNPRIRYWFWLQGGGRLQLGETKSIYPQIDMIHGIQKQSKMRLGIGIGTRFLLDDDVFLIPFYAHLQTASNAKVAPMAAIGAGMITNPKFNWKIGGPFLRGDMGIQFALESGGFFTLTIGFEQMNFITRDSFRSESNTENYLTLNLGIML